MLMEDKSTSNQPTVEDYRTRINRLVCLIENEKVLRAIYLYIRHVYVRH